MSRKDLDKYVKLVPNGTWKKEKMQVYRYNGMTYISLFCLCVGLGLFMLAGSIINFVSGSKEVGFALAFCAFMLIALGVVFWLYITRCVLIFYPGGLAYRNLVGEVFNIADEDVLYVMSLGFGKNRCFVIKTKQKNITWSVHARFFYEAERVALDRYPDEKEYGKKK